MTNVAVEERKMAAIVVDMEVGELYKSRWSTWLVFYNYCFFLQIELFLRNESEICVFLQFFGVF